MIIYNLFPLLAGTCNKWVDHFRRAADMGFDWIFVNPIQNPGKSGSLYSIADYFQINPRLVDRGSRTSPEWQMEEACTSARRLGLNMMVDLVVNHCAADSIVTRDHPAWFMKDKDGSIAHPFCVHDGKKVVWTDLARFDHEGTSDGEGLYRYVVGIIEYLAGLGFSGFRCDAAYQIPAPFWQRLIAEVKGRHPEMVFTAETLGCTPEQTAQTARTGFDYVFNSSKWWNLGDPWLLEQYELVREAAPSISFPESHDTPRLFEELQGNVDAVKQRFFFASFFSAGSMVPIGFEFGFRKPLHVVDTRPQDWEDVNVDLRDFIGKVNAVKRRFSIFQEDCPTRVLKCKNPNILLLWKTSKRSPQEALLILNKDMRKPQRLYENSVHALVRTKAPLMDVSPEQTRAYVPAAPFSYDLRPGQGVVLVSDIKAR
jgi:starch synthase (maltosyl-transferring)